MGVMLQGDSQLRAVATCDDHHASYDRRVSAETRRVQEDFVGDSQREKPLEPVRRMDE